MKTEEVVTREIGGLDRATAKYPFDCPHCLQKDPPVKYEVKSWVAWIAHHGWVHDPRSRKRRLTATRENAKLRMAQGRRMNQPALPANKKVKAVWGGRGLTEEQLESRRETSRNWRRNKKKEREENDRQVRNQKARVKYAAKRGRKLEVMEISPNGVQPLQARTLQRAANFEHLIDFLNQCQHINEALAYVKAQS